MRNERSNMEENYMGLISWVVVGTIAGLVARRIVPGPDPGRFIVTIILGMAGASLGGSPWVFSGDPERRALTSGPCWWRRSAQ
jgi:hypothetical protein